MAAPVLAVGHAPDEADILRQILEGAGHSVSHVPTTTGALTLLGGHPERWVVLLGTRLGTGLLERAECGVELGRHAFVLITAIRDMLPAVWLDLVHRLHIPVVPKPFTIEHLVATVDQAARGPQRPAAGDAGAIAGPARRGT